MANNTSTPAPQVTTSAGNSVPIIAMILGVVSLATFTWFLGIPAIVLGIIGLKKYNENRGFSITGLITGIISTILFITAIFFFIVLITLGILHADDSSVPRDSSDGYHHSEEEYRDRYRADQEGA